MYSIQYYIVNCEDGTVETTYDENLARKIMENDSYVVINLALDQYHCGSLIGREILEFESETETPEDGEEEMEGEHE